MSRHILVLGADGYIGRRVMAGLAGSGWAAPVAAGRREVLSSPHERIRLDATDQVALARALAGVEGVVNCIAADGDTMIAAARALFAAAEATRPRIVHLSSMAVYGTQTGEIEETAPLVDDTGAYGSAKIEIERLAAGYGPVTVLRPGCVYGPDSPQWTTRIAGWLQARRLGDLGAAGDGIANLVHVEDVVAAVLASLDKPRAEGQAYNLAMAGAPDWNGYLFRFAKALGAVPIKRIGNRALKIETKFKAPPLKIAEILARKAKLNISLPEPIPPSLLRLFRQDIRLVPTKAERDLGLAWTDLDQALAAIAASL
ncbi:MAG TPA: NAD-dependent epimerase/dehydratase family protein [Stellaceae bacterium]|nr:NAD-dependent epimerase/dehydratase family protein [Stellaceae bacterium]